MAVLLSGSSLAAPLGTAFTYQGQLKKSGARVNDSCSLIFTLWDDPGTGTCPAGGNQIGPTLCFASAPSVDCPTPTGPAIAVTEGLFTVQLDFGANAADGTARWLQISVQCPSDVGFTSLCPRHELTAAPYSLRTRFVDNPELTDTIEAGGISGDPGSITAFNNAGEATVSVLGDGLTNAGEIILRNATGDLGVLARGDIGGAQSAQVQLLKEDGDIGVVLEAGPDSNIQLRKTSTEIAINLQATDGGSGGSALRMYNGQSPNRETVTLIGNGINSAGEIWVNGNAGDLQALMFSAGDGGAFEAFSRLGGSVPVFVLTSNDPDGAARLYVRNPQVLQQPSGHESTIILDGQAGGGGGEIRVYNGQPSNPETVSLHGNAGGGGRVLLWDQNGALNVELRGGTGGATFCGSVQAGAYSTVGCDVAEAFELSEREAIKPGMVMVLDEERPGHLRISTKSYDTKVAGIVSGAKGTRPGLMLGGSQSLSLSKGEGRVRVCSEDRGRTEQPPFSNPATPTAPSPLQGEGSAGTGDKGEGVTGGTAAQADVDNDLPIALSGRVYCLVDATKHAVRVGDLLTTSDTPGHAMKVKNHRRSQGAVLGKAMEPLEKGKKDLVLVLVSLQ